ncbi:mechanosensitive ion channel family protein [Francisella philomiragia]|uniref:mechanosensitive ion channel family protein n=2 Tax=Francisella philomiragia TaxID=28110 RepID=UPI001906A29C|nr:mechanosensitive ion channel family protein [Francisella philomiragia]MBK2267850.1 mechanosensitive ion channel family protein [Francisella philomiragia]MBK2279440.1 mechanosensitive ion channel family protein [Francisella philomiragia]MBK2287294.1 mechanosensitive ion channel family protein [Francisella philomiragia]MBK2289272.1 mechanosensitive ion channel family protein [Francisella philomiragia]MBK2290990.1 mechanosensitive ion channel family protein [Francisella philomiragia]
MNKKKNLSKALLFLKIVFLILFILSAYAYIKPMTNATYLSETQYKVLEDGSFGFLSKSEMDKFNDRTPQNLFTNFTYKALSLWMGYHNYYYDVINTISSEPIKVNDYTSSEKDIDIDTMLVAILKTDFRISDIPNDTTGDRLDLTLGKGNDKQTFYLAKNSDGNWYFTKENFTDANTLKKFADFKKEKSLGEDNIRNISMPVLSYMQFIFGANDAYKFKMADALDIMDTSWISENIRKDFASFIAFSMDRVFKTAKITIRNIPGEVLPGSNLVMVYTSPTSGKSIYLENITNKDTNTKNWIFPKNAQLDGVSIFLDELNNNVRAPFGSNLRNSIWENIPSLLKEYGPNLYINIISIISLMLFYVIYKVLFVVLTPIFRVIGSLFENKDYKTMKKLSIATSLIISMYAAYFFFFNSLIIFTNASNYFDIIFKIVYGIVVMFLCTEIMNVLCSFIISSYKKVKDQNRSARFAFAIIIANKVINLIIILIIAGVIIQELGIDMIHFLAALGIGGLAIALAGKDTIENLFGSIILAVERPIKIGDWVIIKDKEGIVEKIGLRSTTIRTFEDSALIIPNYAFVTSQINNMGERIYRRYMTTLEIDESTTTAKLRSYVDAINELVLNTPYMRKEGYYIRVNDLKPASIKILVYVFFISADWGEELKQREQFIMSMLDLAEEIGIKLAPSQKIQFDANYSD